MGRYLCIWAFRLKPESVSGFERAYGREGDWARLFRRAEGYLGTELLRDADDRFRFVTIDQWRSRQDYERFQTAFAAEYAAIDQACATYTVEERLIGHFTAAEQ